MLPAMGRLVTAHRVPEVDVRKFEPRFALFSNGLNGGVHQKRTVEFGHFAGAFSFYRKQPRGKRLVPFKSKSCDVTNNRVELFNAHVAGKRNGIQTRSTHSGIGKQTFERNAAL